MKSDHETIDGKVRLGRVSAKVLIKTNEPLDDILLKNPYQKNSPGHKGFIAEIEDEVKRRLQKKEAARTGMKKTRENKKKQGYKTIQIDCLQHNERAIKCFAEALEIGFIEVKK